MGLDGHQVWDQNHLLRIAGEDAPAMQVLQSATERLAGVIQLSPSAGPDSFDYAQIDPSLHVEFSSNGADESTPSVGVGYAGLTPHERGRFLRWATEPTTPAPPAFQQLYLAQLEVGLLEQAGQDQSLVRELRRLARSAGWRGHVGLARTLLLAYWLGRDGAGLADWSGEQPPPPDLAGILLGCQGLLGHPLQSAQIESLWTLWTMSKDPPQETILTRRLQSLTTHLGAEPLTYALAQLGEQAYIARPWRPHHRNLRLAFPQPDVRPVLQPLLAEAANQVAAPAESEQPAPEPVPPAQEALGWHMVIEFGHSRSDLFHFALTIAQRQPGFKSILDENRKAVYRVIFKRSEMRQFWRLWDYVQGWSNSRVYLNGVELEKWQVYPYSQFMR
jgi:hypothetical protein